MNLTVPLKDPASPNLAITPISCDTPYRRLLLSTWKVLPTTVFIPDMGTDTLILEMKETHCQMDIIVHLARSGTLIPCKIGDPAPVPQLQDPGNKVKIASYCQTAPNCVGEENSILRQVRCVPQDSGLASRGPQGKEVCLKFW